MSDDLGLRCWGNKPFSPAVCILQSGCAVLNRGFTRELQHKQPVMPNSNPKAWKNTDFMFPISLKGKAF